MDCRVCAERHDRTQFLSKLLVKNIENESLGCCPLVFSATIFLRATAFFEALSLDRHLFSVSHLPNPCHFDFSLLLVAFFPFLAACF